MFAAVALFAVAVVYHLVGFRSLLFGSGESVPIDFRLRWIESNLLMEGKDSHSWGHPDAELPPRLQWQRTLGGGYPPWATATGLLLAPPVSWPLARTWFALLNLAGMAVISWWTYSIGITHSRPFALFLVAAALACAPVAICVSYGQYAVLITAALVIGIMAFERNHECSAGLALGLSLIKPQLAAMAVVTALIRRKYLAAIIAGAIVTAGCGIMWAMSGIDPLTALRDSQADAKKFSSMSVNPLTAWLLPVLGFERTTLFLGLSFLAVGSATAWFSPSHVRLSVLFAVAVIISMFWSYRRGYDCPLLIIPMVLLFEAAATTRSVPYLLASLAFGVSLWLPVRNEQWSWTAIQVAQLIIWVTGGVLLVLSELKRKPQSIEDHANPRLAEAAA